MRYESKEKPTVIQKSPWRSPGCMVKEDNLKGEKMVITVKMVIQTYE